MAITCTKLAKLKRLFKEKMINIIKLSYLKLNKKLAYFVICQGFWFETEEEVKMAGDLVVYFRWVTLLPVDILAVFRFWSIKTIFWCSLLFSEVVWISIFWNSSPLTKIGEPRVRSQSLACQEKTVVIAFSSSKKSKSGKWHIWT